jgi:predicted metal-dependent hydrolase
VSLRQLKLADGQTIPYLLKVSARRRTIGLKIDDSGLTVHIPRRVAASTVEQILQQKSGWIASKLAQRQQRPAAIEWQDGTTLRYLGQEIRLALRQDARIRAPEFDGNRLHLALPDPGDAQAVQRKAAQWLAKQCRPDFSRRIELLAAKLGVPTPPLYLSSARTRWGSCNSRGEIRLNWRLIQAPPHIIHYVVAHELAHLKEMNHSPKFWAWVKKLCPEYEAARKELKAISAELHLI